MTFKRYPSTEHFRNTVTSVKQWAAKRGNYIPVLTFYGTVKVHGTNGGVGYDVATDTLWAQSRERVLTLDADNAGFAAYVFQHEEAYKNFFRFLADGEPAGQIIMYGEWAGPGVQAGVGVSQLNEKMFFPFQIQYVTGEGEDAEVEKIPASAFSWSIASMLPRAREISDFGTYEITIDFNAPHEVQNKLVEMTEAVEKECPVAKAFGIENGVGEGIVWSRYLPEGGVIQFKVKGEKHSTSRVKTVAVLSEADLERLKSIDTFVESVLPEARLSQGLDKLREMGLAIEMKSLGDFLKWIGQDVLREEGDVITAAGIERKELMPKVTAKAKAYFMEAMKEVV